MSLLNDLKNVSDSAIERLAARFGDLPKPLLAAIGAGDVAVERLARLREQVGERLGVGDGVPSGEDVKAFANDLPGKAQKIAGDVAHQLEQFAAEVPGRAQQLIGELPAKAQEFSNSLSPDNLKSTIESYTQLVAQIYGNLADRGGETVAKARPERASKAASAKTGNGGAADGPRDAKRPAPKRSASRKPAPRAEAGSKKDAATENEAERGDAR